MLLIIHNIGEHNSLFLIAILLYLIAAVTALILIKHHKLCNIASNIICMAAALVGAAASLIKIFTGTTQTNSFILQSTIPQLSMNIRIDTLSAFFVLCLSVLVFSVSIYSIGYISHYYGKRNVGLFNFLYVSFILSMFLLMIAGNSVFFYIAWEAMSIISYFLVIFESEREENLRAGKLYIIMTHLGTAFLLIGFMMMYSYTQSFDIFGSSAAIPAAAKNLMFVFFLIGFGTKAGVMPLHIWLPQAHPAAPSNVSALMSGIMIKTAIYGMIRFMFCYLQIQDVWWGVVILCVGIVSTVLGVAYALMEHNIKKILAFSSVENIGIILIGLGVSFIAFAQNNEFLGGLALVAALLHTFNHTLFKGGLFLSAGSIQYATHTKELDKLGGLIKKMPITALMVLCFSLAISAVVPFNGFVSEWLVYQSLFLNIGYGGGGLNILSILSIAALGLAGALAAACFVKLFGISFLGLPRSDNAQKAKEVPATMNIGMGMLAGLCLASGLFPGFFIDIADKVVRSLTGLSITANLQGGFLNATAPLVVSGNSIAPLEILIVILALIAGALLIIRLIGGKYIERKYGTWDCGFEALNSRMQYTATGFSKPLRIVFSILYRPGRKVEIEEGISSYFPTSIKYKVWTEPIFEKYFYNPVLNMVSKISLKIINTVQTGSIHAYLIYIFIAVLTLMLYNRLA
ncbi:proton-conducting transporter membrane subunit [Acetobacterium bakii]|uniref:Formate hydrogenlyase n=1 Tax=Acetobacterium bakii TaxID=52689 RepID=A0A0L6TZV4_9FIRM|nr:proton-conducting transporter membrane subunit [Acetobacterium bakii]KNZ41791.1 formate hydrogenlyase [Acetobacterium bakii]